MVSIGFPIDFQEKNQFNELKSNLPCPGGTGGSELQTTWPRRICSSIPSSSWEQTCHGAPLDCSGATWKNMRIWMNDEYMYAYIYIYVITLWLYICIYSTHIYIYIIISVYYIYIYYIIYYIYMCVQSCCWSTASPTPWDCAPKTSVVVQVVMSRSIWRSDAKNKWYVMAP